MTNDLNYEALGVIIAGAALLVTLFFTLYRVGEKLGKLEGFKKVMDSNLEALNQKYNTAEKDSKSRIKC